MQKYQVFLLSVQAEFAKERKQLAEYCKSDPLLSQFFVPFIFEGLNTPDFDLNEGFKVTIWRPSMVTDYVADYVADYDTGQATGQATGQVTEGTRRVVMVFKGEMKGSEIKEALDLKHRESFRDNYLLPAIEQGFIEMTIPDKPNSPNQKYRLTSQGVELKKIIEKK